MAHADPVGESQQVPREVRMQVGQHGGMEDAVSLSRLEHPGHQIRRVVRTGLCAEIRREQSVPLGR